MSQNNKVFSTVKVPQGLVQESDFALVDTPYPTLEKDGEFIAKVDYFSVDPYLRAAMLDPAYKPGAISNFLVATVVESKSEKYPVGTVVQAHAPMASFVKLSEANPTTFPAPTNDYDDKVKMSFNVGVLGMPGRTAYFGAKYGLSVKEGDTVLISAAAGIVGSLVGQIARMLGAKKVVGTAGSDEKCEYVVKRYGFDACYNYKTLNTKEKMDAMMKTEFPNGLDCYFDNTGDHVTEAVWDNTAYCARVAICGQISKYNDNSGTAKKIDDFLFKLVYKQVRVQGIIYSYYMEKQGLAGEANTALVEGLKAGKLVVDETVLQGIESLPTAFCGLYSGLNFGKMVVAP